MTMSFTTAGRWVSAAIAPCSKTPADPDLRCEIERLIAPLYVASRLRFDVTPAADFLGLSVNGRRVTFC